VKLPTGRWKIGTNARKKSIDQPRGITRQAFKIYWQEETMERFVKQRNIAGYICGGHGRAGRLINEVCVESLMDWCVRYLRRGGFLFVPWHPQDRFEWMATIGIWKTMEHADAASDRGRSNVRRGNVTLRTDEEC
jgi:hypothetical protein